MQQHIINDIINKNVIILMNATQDTLQHELCRRSMQIKLGLVLLRFSRKYYDPPLEWDATKPSLTHHPSGDATNGKNPRSGFLTFTVRLFDLISFYTFYKIKFFMSKKEMKRLNLRDA